VKAISIVAWFACLGAHAAAQSSTEPNLLGASIAGGKVTYNKDIAVIIFKHCVPCHRPGEVGPFPLLTYSDVSRRAKLIGTVTERHIMPPWKPEPSYGQFRGARRLEEAEIKAISQWVAEGAPEGKKEDLRATPQVADTAQLGKPDLVLTMSKPFTVPADSPEFYRCFVIPTNLEADQFVVAFEDQPSNRKVVHHAILAQDRHQAGRKLESQPGDGYPCMGSFGFPVTGYLGIWTAGTLPRREPEGIGTPLRQGSDLIMQIHFRPSGKPETEQSTIKLYFAKQPPLRIPRDLSVSTYDVDIPAGEKKHKARSFSYVLEDVEALSIFPHAHFLAKELKASATLPDDTVQPLLWIKNWDFNWQEEYFFASPLKLPQGTRLDMEFTYDNSSENPRNPNQPPKRVTWGETTTDEMAEIHLRVVSTKTQPQVSRSRTRNGQP
jgi:mono/diheme cytochrome c family protein